MTWKEFKEHVEREMEKNGISEDEDLFYIDLNHYEPLNVSLDEDLGILIT